MNKNKTANLTFTLFTLLVGLILSPAVPAVDVNKLVAGCGECHGKDGVSTDGDIPIIAGFSEKYIIDSMKNYKNKARPCPKEEYQSGSKKGQKSDMCTIASETSDADVQALAKYFSGKTFIPAKQNFDAAMAAKGKELHEKKCEKCHTEGGTLPDDDNGILAGQWMPYLTNSINEFTTGKRPVPKKMQPKIKDLQQADFDALINYYGSF